MDLMMSNYSMLHVWLQDCGRNGRLDIFVVWLRKWHFSYPKWDLVSEQHWGARLMWRNRIIFRVISRSEGWVLEGTNLCQWPDSIECLELSSNIAFLSKLKPCAKVMLYSGVKTGNDSKRKIGQTALNISLEDDSTIFQEMSKMSIYLYRYQSI